MTHPSQRPPLTIRTLDGTPVTVQLPCFAIGSFMHLHWLHKDLVASWRRLPFNKVGHSDGKEIPYQVGTTGPFLGKPSSVQMVHKVCSNQYYRLGTPRLTGPWHLHDDKWDLTLVSVRNKSLLVPHTDMQAVNVDVVGHSIRTLQRISPTGRPMDDTPVTDTITDYQDTGWYTSHSVVALLCLGSFMHLHWLHKDLVASQWQLSFNSRSHGKVIPYQVRTRVSFLGEPSSVQMVHKVCSNQLYRLGTPKLSRTSVPFMSSSHGIGTWLSYHRTQRPPLTVRPITHTPITEITIDCRDIGRVITMGLGCEPDMQQTGMGPGNDLIVTDAIAVS